MRLSNHDELRELLEFDGSPTVSIYLPLHGHGRDAEADRLRLRAALDRARELLARDHPEGGWTPMLEDLEPLASADTFWGRERGGLALYLSSGFRRGYRVPSVFPELVVVAPTFHVRPLVEHLASAERFYVLELSRKRVRLWEGGPDAVQPVPAEELPRDLADALGYEYERDEKVVLRRKERDGAHGEHGRGGIMPVFHGHGVGLDDREPELEAFFREVDQGLRSFLAGRRAPVILATVEENEALFRSVSELEQLSEDAVNANVGYWSPEELHEAAWPLAESEAARRIVEALQLWEAAPGEGEGDLANLAHLALQGRVRLLLVEEGRRVWGTVDRATGRTRQVGEAGEDPGADVADILDELMEIVLLHGGEVLSLPAARMPTGTGAAGILR